MNKTKFLRKTYIVIAAVLAALALTLFSLFVPASQKAKAAAGDVSFTLSVKSDNGNNYVIPGGTLTLTVTGKAPGRTDDWSALSPYVTCNHPDKVSLVGSVSFNGNFGDPTAYTDDSTDMFGSLGYLLISLAGEQGKDVPCSTDFVATATIKVAEDFDGGSIEFSFHDEAAVGFSNLDYFMNGDPGFDVSSTASITVSAPKSGTDISAIQVGTEASSVADIPGFSAGGTNFTYVSTAENRTLYVRPTIAQSAGAASWQVRKGGTVCQGNPAAVPLDNSGSTNVEIVVTAEDNTSKTYNLTILNKYARLSGMGVSVNTQTLGVTKSGLTEDFDANKFNYTVNVPSDATQSVSVTPTVMDGYGSSTTVTVQSPNNCTAASSVASGSPLAVSNIGEGATLTLVVTTQNAGGSSTTQTYNIVFHVFSVDNSISNFTVVGSDNVTIRNDSAQADGVNRFYFFVPATAGAVRMNITAAAGSTVTVNGSAYDPGATYSPNTYTVVVTAAAGNTKSYSVVLGNEVVNAAFTSLEVSVNQGTTWVDVFKEPNDPTSDSYYNSVTYTYTAVYNLNVRAVTIQFTASEPTANITQSGCISVNSSGGITRYVANLDNVGDNNGTLTITTGSGSRTYNFVFKRLENKNGITNVSLGINIDGYTFSADTTEYNVSVPYANSVLNFTVTTDALYARVSAYGIMLKRAGDDANGSRTHNGSISLNQGLNVVEVYAVSDNGSGKTGQRYTFRITVNPADSDSRLSNLELWARVEGESTTRNLLDGKFTDPDVTTYLLENTTIADVTVEVKATARSSVATVQGAGSIRLSNLATESMQIINVTVVAENGTSTTYRITISKGGIDLNDAKDITTIGVIYNGRPYMNEPFVSSNTSYTADVPFLADYVYLDISTNSLKTDGAIVVINNTTSLTGTSGNWALRVGVNEFTIYAVSQDGNKSDIEYTLVITRAEQSNDNSLATITVNSERISGFDTDKYDYSMNIGSSVESVSVYAESNNQYAIMLMNIGSSSSSGIGSVSRTQSLNRGDTITVTIAVTVDGSTATYTLRITRTSSDAELSSLYVDGFTLTDASGNIVTYEPQVKNYYLYIPYYAPEFNIVATAFDPTVEIRGAGIKNVTSLFGDKPGQYTNQIAVIPVQGDIAIYNLHITRRAPLTGSTDADITITQIEDFNKEYSNSGNVYGAYKVVGGTTILDINVHFTVDEYSIAPTYKILYNGALQNAGDGVNIDGTQLHYGLNVVTVDITSNDGSVTRSITIIVNRNVGGVIKAEVDEISDFAGEFSADKSEYFYTVGNEVEKLNVDFLLEEGFTYEIEDTNLKEGLNTVKVKLFDKDGVESDILLNVYREPQARTNTTLLIVVVVISVIEAMLLAAAVVVIIMKKHSDEE